MPFIDQQARDVMFDDGDMDDLEDDYGDFLEDLLGPGQTGAKSAARTGGRMAKSGINAAYQAGYYGTWAGGYVAQGLTGALTVGGQTVAAFTAPLAGGAAAAAGAAATVSGPVGIAFALIDSTRSAVSAVKTYRHVNALERILKSYGQHALNGTVEAILFAIKKKNKKLKRTGVGCVPVLGSICNSVYTTGRTIKKRVKGTRGHERRAHAETLWRNAQHGDLCARSACIELLGEKIHNLIDGYSDGHLVLKKKMKSL